MTRLVLAGGGHAHLHVLRELARRRPSHLTVTLVTPYERQLYSGMLPGWIAGHYGIDDMAIPLAPWIKRAGIAVVTERVARIDLREGVAYTPQGEPLGFDVLSLAVGSEIALNGIVGAERWGVPLRPIEDFVATWSALGPRLAEADRPLIAVIGAGAGGAEVALAVSHRMRTAGNGGQVQLITGGALLPSHNAGAQRRVRRALVEAGVRVFESAARRIDGDHVVLDDGSTLASDMTLIASGAAPAAWLRDTGLARDETGFIQVDRCLRSVSHPNVYAAGDIASMVDEPRARSGVYAVRAGPPLATNLLRASEGESPARYTPQRTALYLLATRPGHAIASWGRLAWQGDWVWRWKDRIDRRFVSEFRSA